jgi:hypothetical protein
VTRFLLLAACARLASAADVAELVVAPDVALALPGEAQPLLDREAVRMRPGSFQATPQQLLPIPEGVGLAAFDLGADGTRYFVIEGFADLGIGVTVPPNVILQVTGEGRPERIAGAIEGLVPDGIAIDALKVLDPDFDVLLSIDVAARLPGGVDAQDEDVIRYQAGDGFSVALDLSAVVPDGLDLDGLDRTADGGVWFLSFDGSGEVGGVPFDDEDVLAFDGTSWSTAFDGSAAAPAWEGADLAAVAVLPDGIFSDPFETGELDRWSSRFPAP